MPVKSAELHEHAEGAIGIKTVWNALEKTCKHFGIDPALYQPLFLFAEAQEAQLPTNNLLSFIRRLVTPHLRYGLLILYSEMIMCRKPMEMVRSAAEMYLTEIISSIMERVGEENLEGINLLISAWNMGIDGDVGLKFPEVVAMRTGSNTPPEKYHPLEKMVYDQWEKIRQTIPQNQREKYFLTSEDYLKLVRKESQKHEHTTLISFAIRRDSDFTMLVAEHGNVEKVADYCLKMFKEGTIDLVDLCGNEVDLRFLLQFYVPFLHALEKRGVPYTLHFLEIPDPEGKSAEEAKKIQSIIDQNARTFLIENLHPVMIAHAAQMGNLIQPFMPTLWGACITREIAIALCPASNEMTRTSTSPLHKIIQLLRDKPEIYRKLFRITIATDDSAVTSPTGTPLGVHELELHLVAQDLARNGNVEEERDRLARANCQVFWWLCGKISEKREKLLA